MSTLAYTYNSVKSLQTSLTQLNGEQTKVRDNLAVLELEAPLTNIGIADKIIKPFKTKYKGEYTSFSNDDEGFTINKECLATVFLNIKLKAKTPEEEVDIYIKKDNGINTDLERFEGVFTTKPISGELYLTLSETSYFNINDKLTSYVNFTSDTTNKILECKLSIVVLKEF